MNYLDTLKKMSVYLILLLVHSFFNSQYVYASNCQQLFANTAVTIETMSADICVDFLDVTPDKTYIVADPSLQGNAAYKIDILTSTGTSIFQSLQKATGSSSLAKLDTKGALDIKLKLNPITDDTSYAFWIVYDKNIGEGTSTIYIGLSSVYRAPLVEPNEPCLYFCEIRSIEPRLSETSQLNSITKTEGGDAPECTDENRPPEASPVSRTTGEKLNINNVLRTSNLWQKEMRFTHSREATFVASFLRVVMMHRTGGALDFAHASDSYYVGSEAMGNFMFGANMRAMGFHSETIVRGSHGYQALSDNGYTYEGFGQGFLNYVTRSGDDSGDQAMVARGIKYFDEVHRNNPNDPSSSSCIDSASKNASDEEGGDSHGTGSGAGGSEGGGLDSVTPTPPPPVVGSWEEWCLVQSGSIVACWWELN